MSQLKFILFSCNGLDQGSNSGSLAIVNKASAVHSGNDSRKKAHTINKSQCEKHLGNRLYAMSAVFEETVLLCDILIKESKKQHNHVLNLMDSRSMTEPIYCIWLQND